MVESDKIYLIYHKQYYIFVVIVLMLFLNFSVTLITGSSKFAETGLWFVAPEYVFFIGYILLAIFVIIASICVEDYISNIIPLTLDYRGINLNDRDIIKWDEIEGIYFTKKNGFKYLTLNLKNKCAERVKFNYYLISNLFSSDNELSFATLLLNRPSEKIYESMLRFKQNSNYEKNK